MCPESRVWPGWITLSTLPPRVVRSIVVLYLFLVTIAGVRIVGLRCFCLPCVSGMVRALRRTRCHASHVRSFFETKRSTTHLHRTVLCWPYSKPPQLQRWEAGSSLYPRHRNASFARQEGRGYSQHRVGDMDTCTCRPLSQGRVRPHKTWPQVLLMCSVLTAFATVFFLFQLPTFAPQCVACLVLAGACSGRPLSACHTHLLYRALCFVCVVSQVRQLRMSAKTWQASLQSREPAAK